MKRNLIISIIAAVVLVAGVVALSGGGSKRSPIDYGTVTLTGNEIQGTNFNDEAVTARGPRLLVFAAHWCPHCRAELPLLAHQAFPVPLTYVSTEVRPDGVNYPPADWFAKLGITSVIRDDAANNAQRHFGVTGFPFFVLLRADGTTATRSGEVPVDELTQWIVDNLTPRA